MPGENRCLALVGLASPRDSDVARKMNTRDRRPPLSTTHVHLITQFHSASQRVTKAAQSPCAKSDLKIPLGEPPVTGAQQKVWYILVRPRAHFNAHLQKNASLPQP